MNWTEQRHPQPVQGKVVTRFAPSPTGYLHAGHAYSALLNQHRAKAAEGSFVLRVEDIDTERCHPSYVDALFEDLSWLGLRWDDEPLRQSERLDIYQQHLDQLERQGLVYRSFDSHPDGAESLRAPHDPPRDAFTSKPLATMQQRDNHATGRPFAWRLSMAAAASQLGSDYRMLEVLEQTDDGSVAAQRAEPWRFGDAVLGRRDSGTSYHLASVVDDATQGVTHVVRGRELREAADLHVLLCALLGFDPPVYHHHRIITDSRGRRLSKRDAGQSLRELRRQGVTVEDLVHRFPPPRFATPTTAQGHH